MTLTIVLPPELEHALREQAAQSGQDLTAFILQAVREKIVKSRTLEEVCAPFAGAVEASGISEEEFDRFFDEARTEAWQQRQGNSP